MAETEAVKVDMETQTSSDRTDLPTLDVKDYNRATSGPTRLKEGVKHGQAQATAQGLPRLRVKKSRLQQAIEDVCATGNFGE